MADTVKRLNPRRKISVEAQTADGVPACGNAKQVEKGNLRANFLEGWDAGADAWGSESCFKQGKGRENAEEYGRQAAHFSPVDNPYVLEMLNVWALIRWKACWMSPVFLPGFSEKLLTIKCKSKSKRHAAFAYCCYLFK